MIEALITGSGHDAVCAANGAKAMETCTRDIPDLVLLDFDLHGQYGGFEVCHRLRENPATHRVPIVVLSSADDATSREQATNAGATAYFAMPFSPIALLKEVARITEVPV